MNMCVCVSVYCLKTEAANLTCDSLISVCTATGTLHPPSYNKS